MYRYLLVIVILLSSSICFSRKMAMPLDTVESQSLVAVPVDTIADSLVSIDSSVAPPQKEVKEGKTKKDEVDKESLGYKIGYQIGSWLIPGILMILVTVMIFMRAKKGRDQNPGV